MTTLRINITKEVLEATKDCGQDEKELVAHNCAIAYAIRGIWPEGYATYVSIWTGEHQIPHDQRPFLHRFDTYTPSQRAAMQPFSFEIEVPDEVIGEVNIEEIRRICEGSKTLEIVN